MSPSTGDIINVVNILADQKSMRVTVNESLKGGLIAGCSAACGGLVMGPLGLAVGM